MNILPMEKQKITVDSIVVASNQQISSELDNEVVILSFSSESYLGLNEVGARVWQLIQEPQTVCDVCKVILDEYEIDREHCQLDVVALMENLAAKDLVELRDATIR